MAPRLHLPPSVTREIRERQRADIENALRTTVCHEFNPELRRIDPALEMVWWPERAPRAIGFVNGAYHVVRHPVNGSAALVEALVDELGNPREPGSWVFRMLESSDMWDDRVLADRRRRIQASKDAECARRRREDSDRQTEIRERLNAATRTQVSLDRSVPWTQNAAGRVFVP